MTTHTNNDSTYNPDTMLANFAHAQLAVRRVDHELMVDWHTARDTDTAIAIDRKRDERRWISREIQRYAMHPVIEAAIKLARPYDWQQLFLEWPHTAQGDKSKIAFTQNEDKGRRDIQTVTSIGKYLNRHFALPDHIIRDLVAQHGIASEFKFVHTTAEMIYHLHRGPGSCMVWSEDRGVRCLDGVTRHPYEAYNPKYGWHMAVRIEGDDTIGRALCMNNPDTGGKYYVRSYAKSREGSYSQADNGMENWLREQGYSKHSQWEEGERLAYYETHDEFLAPYLDGSDKCVSIEDGCLVLDEDGEFACDQTGGCPSSVNRDTFECAQCGDDTDEDDGYWVGRTEDERVCQHCLDNDFVYAYGRRGNQYYIATDNAIYVDGQAEWYDPDYLSDNEIVELTNGEYAPMDEAVDINGDWYHIDDERICRTEDTDEYLLCDEGCWQCEESGNWYSDNIDYVEVDGCKYHPDCAPDQDDAEDDGDTAVTVDPVVTSKPVTEDMMREVSLVEDYGYASGFVRFSMTILHNGIRYTAHRNYSDKFIQDHGIDWMRTHLRRVLSAEIITESRYSNTTSTITESNQS